MSMMICCNQQPLPTQRNRSNSRQQSFLPISDVYMILRVKFVSLFDQDTDEFGNVTIKRYVVQASHHWEIRS